MIHIDRLCAFVKQVMDVEAEGVFMPQDEHYVCTCEMVRQIAGTMGKDLKLWKILNPGVWVLKRFTTAGKKAFGDLIYEKEMSAFPTSQTVEDVGFAE